MSIKAMSWAWDQEGLTPSQRIVLFYLADCHNGQNGLCCPKIETIAKWSRMSRATVCRRLTELKDMGLVTWETRRDGFKVISNVYDLPVEEKLPESQIETLERLKQSDTPERLKQSDTQEPEKEPELIQQENPVLVVGGEGNGMSVDETPAYEENIYITSDGSKSLHEYKRGL